MIELNLLPQEQRKKKKKVELLEIPLIPITAIFLGAVLGIQLILSGFMFLGKRQKAGLNKAWQELAPKKAEFDKIKNQIFDLNKKTTAIDRLISTQLNWSRLLNELSNSLPPNIWLNELSYDEKIEKMEAEMPRSLAMKEETHKIKTAPKVVDYKMRTLTMSGSASGRGEEATAHIARFIRALKENENFFREFDDVELVSIKKGVLAEQDIMNFTLVCRFKLQKD